MFRPGHSSVRIFTRLKEVRLQVFRANSNLSYKHTLGRQVLTYKTVGDLVDQAAERYGDRTALVASHQNQRITFLQAKEKVDVNKTLSTIYFKQMSK